MVNQNKINQVSSLSQSLNKTNNFFLIKIEKSTHQSLENLRKELRKNNATVKVIKNTFFEKAINQLSSTKKAYFELREKFFPLKEQTALVSLSDSWDEGLKTFYQYAQKEKILGFKFGLIDNVPYSEVDMVKLANLPSRGELIAKIIGSMKSPMSKFIYTLKYNTNKFVYILQTKSKEVKS